MSSAGRDDDGHIDDQSGTCTGRTLFVTEQACVHVVSGVYLYAQRSRHGACHGGSVHGRLHIVYIRIHHAVARDVRIYNIPAGRRRRGPRAVNFFKTCRRRCRDETASVPRLSWSYQEGHM